MDLIIDNINFNTMESERYWSFPTSTRDPKKEAYTMMLSGDYLGSRKVDGEYRRLVIDLDGSPHLYGRTKTKQGIYTDKIDIVPHLFDFIKILPPGTCLLGELYLPGGKSNDVGSITRCLTPKALDRQRERGALRYYIFDILAWDGVSLMQKTAEYRFNLIERMRQKGNRNFVSFAQYFEGKELVEELENVLADGGEGVVITRKNSLPEPGKRTARKTLKIKEELQDTIDAVVIGINPPEKYYGGGNSLEWPYWYNERTQERCGNEEALQKIAAGDKNIIPITKMFYMEGAGSWRIGLYKGDQIVQIGNLGNLTDEQALNWKNYIGAVVELTAMSLYSDTKKLRHPKLVSFKDKNPQECQWSDYFIDD